MDARSLKLGYLLGLLSGAVLGYSWAEGGGLTVSLVGFLVAILGALVVLYGLTRARVSKGAYEPAGEWDWSAAPPLGQMLVNYKLITEADLNRALDKQRQERQRLGKVLVDMKLVTHAQVAQVLEEQFSRRRHSKSETESG